MAEAFESLPPALGIAVFIVSVPFALVAWRALRRDEAWCDEMLHDIEQGRLDAEKLLAAIHAHAAPGEIRPVKGTTCEW